MTVAQALSELLYEHDAVTVPGLGTFSCDYESAKVNVITNHFERPSATVVFDGQQREENDVLARHLMASDDLTDDEARQQVNRFVADCFAELKAGREVTLPGIGTLRPDAEQAVGFVADASNYNGDAFGLSDFDPEPVYGGAPAVDWRAQVARQLKDQNTPMTVDAKAVHEDFGDEQSFERHRRRRIFLGILTALLLIPAVLLVLYFIEVIHFDLPSRPKPQPTPPAVTHRVPVPDSAMQALLVRYEPIPVVETEVEGEMALDSVAEVVKTVADTVVATAPETPTTQPSVSAEPSTSAEPSAPVASGPEILPIAAMQPYAIIAGCFSQQANAENYLKPIQEQGYPKAFLMQKNGMYYVCYGQYATLDEAKAAHADILANANKKAWILTK